jgi:uncharacterized protein (TIGR02145 family)
MKYNFINLIFLFSYLLLGCGKKEKTYGCTEEMASNYNPNATYSDYSCGGCTDEQALNYNSWAYIDDGSCEYDVFGCLDSIAYNYNSEATINDNSCVYYGCLDPQALNYSSTYDIADGSCIYGEGCNNQSSLTYNSEVYNLIVIGGKCWFKENLKTNKYSNGTPIPLKSSTSSWVSSVEGARCAYNNTTSSLNEYGYLYNFHAVENINGLCPTGFHVSTDEDWAQLEKLLGLTSEEIYFTSWRGDYQRDFLISSEEGGTNELGFNGKFGGKRSGDADGSYMWEDYGVSWWTSTPSPIPSKPWTRSLFKTWHPGIGRTNDDLVFAGKYVRCVKD